MLSYLWMAFDCFNCRENEIKLAEIASVLFAFPLLFSFVKS